MRDSASATAAEAVPDRDDRHQALLRCRELLRREGFTVSGAASRGHAAADLVAIRATRTVRIVFVPDGDVDAARTRTRIRASLREGETRVYVPWPLRWRVLSNLERWGLRGASVSGV